MKNIRKFVKRELKEKVATELDIDIHSDNGNLTCRQAGYIGGYMVKTLLEEALAAREIQYGEE